MKHVKLLLVLSIISLFAVWSMATIEVQTTTPRVNPNGTSEIVGTFRLIFSSLEFQNPDQTSTNTTWFTVVKIQLSQGVKLNSIGEYGLTSGGTAFPLNKVSWTNYIPLAWEADQGVPQLPLMPDPVRIIYADPSTIHILFCNDMRLTMGNLSSNVRARITIGTEANVTPSAVPATMPLLTQENTQLCCNFKDTTLDFQYDAFWRVGLTAWIANPQNEQGIPGYALSVNFQPADPSLAMSGGTTEICEISAYWPEKGDDCNPQSCNQTPAVGDTCPTPPVLDQQEPPPCDDTWNNYIGEATFGSCHWFAITEWCPTTGHFVFLPGGTIDITLNGTTPDLNAEFCGEVNVQIMGGQLVTPYIVDPINITVGATSISIVLPDDIWYSSTHSAPYCILVDLGTICYETCPLLNVPADTTIPVTVDIEYTPPNFVCGTKPAPIYDFKVADIYGCEPVEPEPESYYLVLYFPYFAPVNDPEINWFCGVAVSNYADEATNEGIFYFWEEDGDQYYVDMAPLGGHEMFVSQLDQMDFQRSPGNSDTTPADEAMSGVLFMRVTTPDYWRNYQSADLLSGALAGIDAFVLMGDGNQAYGYTARHIDAAAEFLYDPFSGRAPIWSKKAHK